MMVILVAVGGDLLQLQSISRKPGLLTETECLVMVVRKRANIGIMTQKIFWIGEQAPYW